jgi:hypothetical protein
MCKIDVFWRILGINYLCTYDLYSPMHNVLDAGIGGGWALEFSSFLGPVKWERADRYARIQNIMHRAV